VYRHCGERRNPLKQEGGGMTEEGKRLFWKGQPLLNIFLFVSKKNDIFLSFSVLFLLLQK